MSFGEALVVGNERIKVFALTAAQAIIQPQYRGTGMFGQEADAGPNATNLDLLAAFLGRNPHWSATT
jgi:hypothetical protein